MSIGLLIAFSSLLFEYDDLVTLQMAEHLSAHRCTAYGGSSNLNRAVVVDQQYIVELHFFTLCLWQTVYEQGLVFLHFELLTCDIYNCVHSVKRFYAFLRKGCKSKQYI